MIRTTACLLVCLSAVTLEAGKYNPVLKIGDAAPTWKSLPGVDGKKHSLADLKAKDIVVVVFTCNSCPYAVDYEDRLIAFAKKHTKAKVALVAINVNKVPADSLPAMSKRAKQKGFNFPYLYDDSQQIARKFGALRTPEFFVLNRARKVVYMGAMDDSPDASKVKKRHVDDAVAATLSGKKPTVSETISIGCRIRIKKARRRKK